MRSSGDQHTLTQEDPPGSVPEAQVEPSLERITPVDDSAQKNPRSGDQQTLFHEAEAADVLPVHVPVARA
jgi:hypothetical protein